MTMRIVLGAICSEVFHCIMLPEEPPPKHMAGQDPARKELHDAS